MSHSGGIVPLETVPQKTLDILIYVLFIVLKKDMLMLPIW